MNELYAVLLGSPEVYWNGKRLFFPFAKLEALLYYLLVRKKASREELAALLWGDMANGAARQNLRNTLYLLKKLTTENLVLTPSRANILLNTETVSITSDIQEFNEVSLADSLVLYRGEFLAGFACKDAEFFEEWMSRQRESFKEDMIARLTKVIVAQMNSKDYAAAERYLKQLIVLDEYNESAYRTLMKIYERSSMYTKAIEIYDGLRGQLLSQLGIDPQARTKELFERIRSKLANDFAFQPEQTADLFFGRERQVAWLRRQVEEFCSGHSPCVCIIVSGEQGVGKTAIVQRMQETLPIDKITVLKTQCYQAEQDYPYKAWNPIFCQAMDILALQGVVLPAIWYQVISYVFPAVLSNSTVAAQSQTAGGYNIHAGMIEEVMCGILGKVAAYRNLVIIMDDIQWLDAQGRSVLKQLFRTLKRQILCIATCRSSYYEQPDLLTDSFSQHGIVKQFCIDNFTKEEVVRFVEMMLPPEKITDDLQQKLYEYTDGNALFLVESCKLVKMGQNANRLSPRLKSVLHEQLDSLSDNARKVLDVSSAFFNNVGYNDLLAVCGLDEFALVEAVEELEHRRLIRQVNGISPRFRGLVYTYSHIRIRNYVYDQLSSSRKRMIHAKAGSYLEDLMNNNLSGQDLCTEILYHYSQIEERIKVLEYTIKIAERYCSPQYELFPDVSEADRGGSGFIFESKLQIMGYLDKIKGGLAALSAEWVSPDSLSRFKAAYLEMLGRYQIWQGDHLNGLRAIHQLLRLSTEKGFTDYTIKGYQQVVYCGIQIRNAPLIERFADKLLTTSQQARQEAKQAAILRFRGISYALRRQKELAEQCYRQSISQYKRSGQDEGHVNIAACYNYIGDLRRMDADLTEALYYYDQAIRVAGRGTSSAGVAIFLVNAGYAAYDLEQYAKAQAYLEQALALEAQFGEYQGYWCLKNSCTLHCILALVAVRDQRLAEGRSYLERADSFINRFHDSQQAALILRAKLEISICMDHDDKVAAVFTDYLPLSIDEYYRQGREIFSKTGLETELEILDSVYAGKGKG